MGAQQEESLSKNKLSEIGQVGGCLTLIWKMSLNSHFFFTLPLSKHYVSVSGDDVGVILREAFKKYLQKSCVG